MGCLDNCCQSRLDWNRKCSFTISAANSAFAISKWLRRRNARQSKCLRNHIDNLWIDFVPISNEPQNRLASLSFLNDLRYLRYWCFFSMERAAWLALCLVIFGLFWLYPKPMAIFFLVCGILFLIMQGGALSNFIASASSRFSHQQPIYDRIVVTDAMAQMIMEKPIFGWGYETLNANITNYYRWVGEAFIPRAWSPPIIHL